MRPFSFKLTPVLFSLTLLAGLLLGLAIAAPNNTAHVQAQDEDTGLRGLLNGLRDRIDAQPDFLVMFELVAPTQRGDQNITVPTGDTATPTQTSIWEVGDDYICFEELTGTAQFVRCLPFTSILDVVYLNN